MILFKNPLMQREFGQLDKRLYPIIFTMDAIAHHAWMDVLVVTRVFEKDDSTHANPKPYRFIDIAILESGMENSERLRGIINDLFPYGKSGFSTIPKLEHGTGPHFHVQVRPE